MAIDSSLAVRQAVIIHLTATAAVTALVPAAQIHAQTVPANSPWPFIRYGSPTAIPTRATCLDGAEIVVAVHAFAGPRKNGLGATIETAEDHAHRIGKAIAAALDRRRLTIPGGVAKIEWTGSQMLRDDDETDTFHAVVNLRVRCLTA